MLIKRISLSEQHLVTDLFDKYRVFYQYPSDISLAGRFIKERLENNESVIFVALENNKDEEIPVGFTQLYPLFSSGRAIKNWVLNDLYVEAGYRKQGIGEAMIKAAMDFAASTGAAFVQLETAVDNHNAQHLYETIGFKKQPPDEDYFVYRIKV